MTTETDVFLQLIASPFDSEVVCLENGYTCKRSSYSQIYSASFLSALAFYGLTTAAVLFAFCILRSRYSNVYEPRLSQHSKRAAPEAVPKVPFGWLSAISKPSEVALIDQIGLDAVVFLRFTRLIRNLFATLTIIAGITLVPINVTQVQESHASGVSVFSRLTPQYSRSSPVFWVYVGVAYLFDIVICLYLWYGYRAVLRLKRSYFRSPEYGASLHARTLLLSDIPHPLRSDRGVTQLAEGSIIGVIGRDVGKLEAKIREHFDLDQKTRHETGLRRDGARRRANEVQKEIEAIRGSPQELRAMSYGFVTFATVAEAHSWAYKYRHGGPEGIAVQLADDPDNFVWRNLDYSRSQLQRRRRVYAFHITLLTVAWVVPNVLNAVFLTNLSHLALVWPTFRATLDSHRILWGIVQGIVPPILVSLVYYYLPPIFRRLSTKAGDMTKVSRERHVMRKLFTFLIWNQLVAFSLFSTFWGFGAVFINAHQSGRDAWHKVSKGHVMRKIIQALITVTTYWCCWLIQRNLGTHSSSDTALYSLLTSCVGAAVDLGQVLPLLWNTLRRTSARSLHSPATPPAFNYATQYSYFLFYAAVALTFGILQPLALAITAIYFLLDSFTKKYMLLYICSTKHESGGLFWRSLVDRMLVNALFGNIVTAVLVVAQGSAGQNWGMLAALLPLPGMLASFKWYCAPRALAPRAKASVVSDAELEPWLVEILRALGFLKSYSASTTRGQQQSQCLAHLLSDRDAIWTLAHIIPSNTDLTYVETYDMIHVQAYVIHVDMVLRKEVTFKLTEASIDHIISFHWNVYLRSLCDNTLHWPGKENECKEIQRSFEHDVQSFIYWTDLDVLEGLKESGAGELIEGWPRGVKLALSAFFKKSHDYVTTSKRGFVDCGTIKDQTASQSASTRSNVNARQVHRAWKDGEGSNNNMIHRGAIEQQRCFEANASECGSQWDRGASIAALDTDRSPLSRLNVLRGGCAISRWIDDCGVACGDRLSSDHRGGESES
ncbi:uncharacterized protein LTR77_011148 [Saxophila tyrrhenica]|uniref:DUF221-domain-containing protein n=1 Tax=Saxophila tyrrhenica TaxID=1690608 RepID=A0AAV9NW01_9PEZI|nr:hypothetical protein LTR77_011148 [Saxophila tyrrhenica]